MTEFLQKFSDSVSVMSAVLVCNKNLEDTYNHDWSLERGPLKEFLSQWESESSVGAKCKLEAVHWLDHYYAKFSLIFNPQNPLDVFALNPTAKNAFGIKDKSILSQLSHDLARDNQSQATRNAQGEAGPAGVIRHSCVEKAEIEPAFEIETQSTLHANKSQATKLLSSQNAQGGAYPAAKKTPLPSRYTSVEETAITTEMCMNVFLKSDLCLLEKHHNYLEFLFGQKIDDLAVEVIENSNELFDLALQISVYIPAVRSINEFNNVIIELLSQKIMQLRTITATDCLELAQDFTAWNHHRTFLEAIVKGCLNRHEVEATKVVYVYEDEDEDEYEYEDEDEDEDEARVKTTKIKVEEDKVEADSKTRITLVQSLCDTLLIKGQTKQAFEQRNEKFKLVLTLINEPTNIPLHENLLLQNEQTFEGVEVVVQNGNSNDSTETAEVVSNTLTKATISNQLPCNESAEPNMSMF